MELQMIVVTDNGTTITSKPTQLTEVEYEEAEAGLREMARHEDFEVTVETREGWVIVPGRKVDHMVLKRL